MKKNVAFTVSLVLSLALHAILAGVLWTFGNFSLPPARQEATVELVDPEQVQAMLKQAHQVPSDLKGQIVEQDKQLNDEIDQNTRFMSKFNQKVVRETQAALNGQFKNSPDKGGEKKAQEKLGKVSDRDSLEKASTEKSEEKPSKLLTSEDGINTGKKPSLKALTPSFRPSAPRVNEDELAQGGGEGPSATDDHLDNVQVGMETMLSTREFVYYSYYNRIKEKLRQYWQPKIKEKVERIFRQGRTIASNGNKITKIIIVLDEKGVLQKVQVIGPSGVTDLDDAAVEAFRAAAPFPNPPNGIVDSDGTIKIRWDFILEADAGMFDAEQGYARNED